MSRCSHCRSELPPAKGHSGLCPPCRRAYGKVWRAARKAEGRPVISSRIPKEQERVYAAEYAKRPEVRARKAAEMRRYAKDPKLAPKHKARRATRWAIESGRLVRLPCEVCGTNSSQAHHDDYSKPLAVRWLCRKHHQEFHARAEE